MITARLGLPLGALLRAYRTGHAAIWSRMFEILDADSIDAVTRREAIAVASDYLFDHVDGVSAMVTDEHTAERDRFLRSREQRRTQLVRDVLEGADPEVAEATGTLDYDLRLHHVALVVSAPDAYRLRTIEEALGRPVTARRAELEMALRLLDLR